ncbi:MAG: MarR family transcriptional regulator [Verrucomicrobia bacterium]|nr:MAG: MarR family transcriptional regulator [Verrucomicrobiota bacterium]
MTCVGPGLTLRFVTDRPDNRRTRLAEPASPPGETSPPTGFPPLLRRCWYGLNQAFRRRLQPLGLTPIQYTVLRNLAEAGSEGLTQTELNDRITSDPNTIAGLVARMEKNGWIERRPDAGDSRAKRVRLTPLGLTCQQQAAQVARNLLAEIQPALSPDQWRLFLEQLEAVAEACQRANQRRP